MFRYIYLREICGYSRERSEFVGICVEVFVPVLKDHEWARMVTNFPGIMEPLYSCKLVFIRGRNDSRKGTRARGSKVERGTLACSSTLWFARFAAICGSAADLRPFALRFLLRFIRTANGHELTRITWDSAASLFVKISDHSWSK